MIHLINLTYLPQIEQKSFYSGIKAQSPSKSTTTVPAIPALPVIPFSEVE